jgi:transglutaminase-like putative cysteine protease
MNLTNLLPSPKLLISRRDIRNLVLSLLFVVIFLIPHIPAWAIAGCFMVASWRYYLEVKKKPLPSRNLRLVLTVVAFLSIYIHYEAFLGRDPGITALVLLSALKLIELKSIRDFQMMVFLCFFLVLGVCLYNQSVLTLVLLLAMVVALTSIMLRVNHPDRSSQTGFPGRLFHSVKLILFALPLVVVLFLFFPRSSGPLWDLPQGGTGFGRSGFSEFIHLGYIAWVAKSYETAFRVTFPDKNMPSYSDLYFRGMVLWFTDGKAWFHGFFPYRNPPRNSIPDGSILQEILLEPHYSRYLFALDRPVAFPSWAGRMPGWSFRTKKPVEKHLRYSVHSMLPSRDDSQLAPVVRKWSLQLPKKLNPRIIRLGEQFRVGAASDREVVNAVLEYFRDPAFEYTLNPGFLNRDDPMGDFLFRSRKGFCEHFASSFALLMRIADVPARMVVGFHGGKYNPIGKYLELRRADAHVWTEVWLETRGWTRIDPTAVVSPERIEYGVEMSNSISSLGSVSDAERSEMIRRRLNKGFLTRLWETLGNVWDNLNRNWNYWVVSYDRDRQDDFLEGAGLVDLSGFTMIIMVITMSWILWSLASRWFKHRSFKPEPLIEVYHRFCKKMERRGFKRHLWEGPLDFKNRIIRKLPERRDSVEEIVSLFIRMRYGTLIQSKGRLKKLKQLVRRLSL